jgi:hypothetical protein
MPVDVVRDDFDAVEARLGLAADATLEDVAQVAQRIARARVRVDTRDLQNSIEVHRIGPQTYTLEAGEAHGVYNEFGTGIYFDASSFAAAGGAPGATGRQTPWVYRHPRYGFITTRGMSPQPYMAPAAEESRLALRPAALANFKEFRRRG